MDPRTPTALARPAPVAPCVAPTVAPAFAPLALCALLASGAAGCVRAVTVQIPHPMTRGTIVRHRVPSPDFDRAAALGLPEQVLTHEATLAAMDAQRVCFSTILRVDAERAPLAQLANWRVFLRGDPGVENMSPVFGPPAPETVAQFQGSVPRQQFAGYYTTCTATSYGPRCTTHRRYVTVRVPAIIPVHTGGGTVCFAHGGQVGPRTEALTLHVDDPTNVGHRVAFRWQFMR